MSPLTFWLGPVDNVEHFKVALLTWLNSLSDVVSHLPFYTVRRRSRVRVSCPRGCQNGLGRSRLFLYSCSLFLVGESLPPSPPPPPLLTNADQETGIQITHGGGGGGGGAE